MTDKEYKDAIKKINTYLDVWKIRLRLQAFKIYRNFVRGPHPNDSETIASCNASWQYLQASIYFYIEAIHLKEMSDFDIETMVVHELVHIHLDETRETEDCQNHLERVTESLARAFRDTFYYGETVGKRSKDNGIQRRTVKSTTGRRNSSKRGG